MRRFFCGRRGWRLPYLALLYLARFSVAFSRSIIHTTHTINACVSITDSPHTPPTEKSLLVTKQGAACYLGTHVNHAAVSAGVGIFVLSFSARVEARQAHLPSFLAAADLRVKG